MKMIFKKMQASYMGFDIRDLVRRFEQSAL